MQRFNRLLVQLKKNVSNNLRSYVKSYHLRTFNGCTKIMSEITIRFQPALNKKNKEIYLPL
ncbi:hypothetical protein AC578_1473 [Pseudocercospora eumusae]|uniref:Uncharacterized protein n=1 Tax=Pseudocercospora eumusae TaxID=321146 RepID=A0A139H6N9_9PEZI|nr:hypothetical protein AC578_1473 [Pseudocercospora eumusae]